MRRLTLHNWVVAIGLGVTLLGLANAASVVSAISSPATTVEGIAAEVGADAWPAAVEGDQWSGQPETVSDQPQADWVEEALPAPSASFLAQFGNEEHADFAGTKDQLLSESHEAEMLYPQEMVEQIRVLPTPVAPEIPLRLVIPAIDQFAQVDQQLGEPLRGLAIQGGQVQQPVLVHNCLPCSHLRCLRHGSIILFQDLKLERQPKADL